MLGYSAADVDDLSVNDFLRLCDALDRHDAQLREQLNRTAGGPQ